MRRRATPGRAFSLIELMIAIVFITIAFFGYVALHARLLHSGQRLEQKEVIRSATDFYSAVLIARATAGMDSGPDGKPFVTVPGMSGMKKLDTTKPCSLDWLTENLANPKSFSEGMDETMQLSPQILSQPYKYSWEKR
jgi:Tfp pilus assembly protein PilV